MEIQDKTKDQLIEELQTHQIQLEMQNEDLKRAHEELAEARDRFSDLFDFAPVGLVTISETGLILEANLRACILLGFPKNQVINRTFHSFVFADDQDAFYLYRRDCLNQHAQQTCELRMVKGDGTTFHVQTESKAIIEGTQQGCLRIAIIDITERKRMEGNLKESEEKFRLIFDNSMDGEMFTAPDGRIIDANKAFCEMVGQTREEICSLGRDGVVDTTDTRLPIALEQRRREGKWRGELSYKRRDGAAFPVEISSKIFQDTEGNERTVISVRDITVRKQAEQQLLAAKEEWEKTFDAIPDLVAILDNQHGIVRVNKAMALRLGVTPDQAIGQKCYKAVHGLDQPPNLCPHVKAMRDGQEHCVEMTEPRLGGVFDVSSSPLFHAQSHLTGAVHVARDITARKKTEEALLVSEEKFRFLAEAMVDIVWTSDLNLRTTYVSPSVESVLGFSPEERKLQKLEEQITPESLVRVRELIAQELELELEGADPARIADLAVEYYRKDGTTVWLENKVRGIRDAEGTLVGLHGLSRDITDRKRAEEALRQSEEKYRLIFNASAVGMMHFDSQGILTACNTKFSEIIGAPKEKLVGMNLLTSLTNQHIISAIKLALSGQVWTGEGEYTSVTGGKTMWAKAIYAPVSASGGEPPGGVAIVEDFTERKLAEDLLRASEERFRLIAETITEVFWMADIETDETLYVSPGYEQVWGQSQESLYKNPKCFIDAVHEEDRERVITNLEAKKQGHRFAIEYRIVRPDGAIRWIWDRGFPVQDQNGKTISYVGVAQDITDRIRSEQEREAMRSQLLQAQKMEAVGTLASGIAHDFNNMLQVILGYSDLLLNEKNKGEPGHAELEKIVKTSIEARDLVQRIRLFSRKADIQPVAVDLNHQISELAKLLSHTVLKNIDIDVRLGGNLGTIKADPALMDQLVTNLAINASEAMPDGGTLTIETQNILLEDEFCKSNAGTKPGPHVLLTISDTGTGMARELLDRIFDPFFSTKQRDYHRGTGLGLSIVKGIVDEHSGYISVESTEGAGTTFKIYFPILAIQQEPSVQVETKAAVATVVGETILLVEDEELVRDLGIAVLSRAGYRVLAVADGLEAVEVYAKERESIALVILDIVMPRMDGKECLQELLKINPAVKVLISSGVAQEDRVQAVVKLGAKGSLIKPYGMKALQEKVREVLDAD